MSKRLAVAGDPASHNVIEWMTAEEERSMMRRRATWCAIGGWVLMSAAAVVSFVVALVMSGEATGDVRGNVFRLERGFGFVVGDRAGTAWVDRRDYHSRRDPGVVGRMVSRMEPNELSD